MLLSLVGRMGRSPCKIGSFLNPVLLSSEMDPSAHRMHLAPLHVTPVGTGGQGRELGVKGCQPDAQAACCALSHKQKRQHLGSLFPYQQFSITKSLNLVSLNHSMLPHGTA